MGDSIARLGKSFEFSIKPKAPYNFRLTVKKPAGWSLFNMFEIYDNQTLWTATHLCGEFIGIKLHSLGTTEKPAISAKIFSKNKIAEGKRDEIRRLLTGMLGAQQDLGEFYRFARKDGILKHTIRGLYGMHDTFSDTTFSEAAFAIFLQMAPIKRSMEMAESFIKNYGSTAQFDGKSIRAWPTPGELKGVTAAELARRCRMGYRAKSIARLAKFLCAGSFPQMDELIAMDPEKAKELLLELPGIGDYSADIINPHGGFPIDVWSAEVFGKLFFGKAPKNNRAAVERVKREGIKRWGKWSWMAFFYVVQDLEGLSKKLGISIRLT